MLEVRVSKGMLSRDLEIQSGMAVFGMTIEEAKQLAEELPRVIERAEAKRQRMADNTGL